MTLLFFALACADLDSEIDATSSALTGAPILQAELADYVLEDDGPLVAQLVEQVGVRPRTFGSVHAEVDVNDGGYVSMSMPTPADGVESVRYRLVIRQALADGSGGAIRELWPATVLWSAESTAGGAPAGWAIETQLHGVSAWAPMSLVSMTLDLRPLETLTVGGSFVVPDLAMDDGTTVSVALLEGGEVVPGVVGAVANGMWGVHLDGPPAAESAVLQPVAYVESDGVLGYDPASEGLVGLACARDVPAFVQWIDEPWDVSVAQRIVYREQDVGWNALTMTSGPHGRVVMPGSMRMDAACE